MPSLLGIIGGIAPESTIDYYRRIVALHRERSPGHAAPHVLIDSIDLDHMLGLVTAGRLDDLTDHLVRELARLARAGADLAILASNTPHIVFDDLRRQSPIPLVSIVEAAGAAAREAGYTRVGLLGTRFTMDAGFYPDVFEREGIAVIPPMTDERAFVHEKYMSELVRGEFLPATRAAMLALIETMSERDRLQAIILGGTELPLALRGAPAARPFLDTTAIHAEAAVSRLLAMEREPSHASRSS